MADKEEIKSSASVLSVLLVTDAIAVVGGLLLTYAIRFQMQVVPSRGGHDIEDYKILFFFGVVIWMISLFCVHLYQPRESFLDSEVFACICKGALLAEMALIVAVFFMRVGEYSRIIFPMALVATITTLTVARFILKKLFVLNVEEAQE